MSLSPARQHRLRVQAEQAAREGGSVRHASGYDLMLLQLADFVEAGMKTAHETKQTSVGEPC